MNILIPMAGLGSRFPKEKFNKPKPLIEVNYAPMITRAVESLDAGSFLKNFALLLTTFREKLPLQKLIILQQAQQQLHSCYQM